MKTAHRHAAVLSFAAMLALLPAIAAAQPIYRIVGPDGKVSFSDKPPASSEGKATALSSSGRSSSGTNTAELPFELREAMNRYPITLYTGDNCEPCNTARQFLVRRGIPYAERTVTSNEDIEALKRMGMGAMIPALTIGNQRLKGYSEGEWSNYLDAAGYPKTSLLPSSYRNAAAAPLAPPVDTPSPPARQAAPTPAAAPVAPPVGPTPDNPAGIVF